MPDFDFDAVVVGAGAVGLACGHALARRGLGVAVLEKEAIAFEPEALALIARGANGSMRDALSLLDQAIAHGAG